jgi:hypothetical protein
MTTNIPNGLKIHQMALKYTKWPEEIPNGHEIYQKFPFKGLQKDFKNDIFGKQINHLTTLVTR